MQLLSQSHLKLELRRLRTMQLSKTTPQEVPEKLRKQALLNQFTDRELEDELAYRAIEQVRTTDHYKCNVDITERPFYCTDHEVMIETVF